MNIPNKFEIGFYQKSDGQIAHGEIIMRAIAPRVSIKLSTLAIVDMIMRLDATRNNIVLNASHITKVLKAMMQAYYQQQTRDHVDGNCELAFSVNGKMFYFTITYIEIDGICDFDVNSLEVTGYLDVITGPGANVYVTCPLFVGKADINAVTDKSIHGDPHYHFVEYTRWGEICEMVKSQCLDSSQLES